MSFEELNHVIGKTPAGKQFIATLVRLKLIAQTSENTDEYDMSNYSITNSFYSKFTDIDVSESIVDSSEWIDEYIKLFKDIGKRGSDIDRKTCLSNMNRFLETYTDVTKDEIMKVTAIYLSDKASYLDDIKYVSNPHYFIFKTNLKTRFENSRLWDNIKTYRNDMLDREIFSPIMKA